MKGVFKKLCICLSFTMLFTGCGVKSVKYDEKTDGVEAKVEDQITLNTFIPKGSYKVVYDGTDLAPNIEYIRGDGEKYQTVGTDGRGAFVNIYGKDQGKLCCIMEYAELPENEAANLENIDYLNKNEVGEKTPILWEPLEKGSKMQNNEITEVGRDLKLDTIQLKGAYVKIIDNHSEGDSKITVTSYYSEGLGCVKYEVNMDGVAVCHYTLKSYTSLK